MTSIEVRLRGSEAWVYVTDGLLHTDPNDRGLKVRIFEFESTAGGVVSRCSFREAILGRKLQDGDEQSIGRLESRSAEQDCRAEAVSGSIARGELLLAKKWCLPRRLELQVRQKDLAGGSTGVV